MRSKISSVEIANKKWPTHTTGGFDALVAFASSEMDRSMGVHAAEKSGKASSDHVIGSSNATPNSKCAWLTTQLNNEGAKQMSRADQLLSSSSKLVMCGEQARCVSPTAPHTPSSSSHGSRTPLGLKLDDDSAVYLKKEPHSPMRCSSPSSRCSSVNSQRSPSRDTYRSPSLESHPYSSPITNRARSRSRSPSPRSSNNQDSTGAQNDRYYERHFKKKFFGKEHSWKNSNPTSLNDSGKFGKFRPKGKDWERNQAASNNLSLSSSSTSSQPLSDVSSPHHNEAHTESQNTTSSTSPSKNTNNSDKNRQQQQQHADSSVKNTNMSPYMQQTVDNPSSASSVCNFTPGLTVGSSPTPEAMYSSTAHTSDKRASVHSQSFSPPKNDSVKSVPSKQSANRTPDLCPSAKSEDRKDTKLPASPHENTSATPNMYRDMSHMPLFNMAMFADYNGQRQPPPHFQGLPPRMNMPQHPGMVDMSNPQNLRGMGWPNAVMGPERPKNVDNGHSHPHLKMGNFPGQAHRMNLMGFNNAHSVPHQQAYSSGGRGKGSNPRGRPSKDRTRGGAYRGRGRHH